ncbi:hypothetical protein N665_0134s0020 [Sinapis alba]|nr:hypothetical protein N665_0134s0020 [Sinapis alba]
MVPRGRKKAGLTREDGARDAMSSFGFEERLITERLIVYGEGGWFLIKECSYMVLLSKCREKSAEQGQTLVEDRTVGIAEEQNDEIVEAEREQTPQQERKNDQVLETIDCFLESDLPPFLLPNLEHGLSFVLKEQEHEQEKQVEDGRDHAGSSSTCLVGCVTETGTQTRQSEDLTITSQTDILDSSPAREASHFVEGAKRSECRGWLSDDDSDSDPDADSVGDDDEIIHLTPEPLSEDLEELKNEKEQEQEQHVEDGRDHASSSSTYLVGCVTETGTQTRQSEDLTITSQTDTLDSSPAREASIIGYASAQASRGFVKHFVEGKQNLIVMNISNT